MAEGGRIDFENPAFDNNEFDEYYNNEDYNAYLDIIQNKSDQIEHTSNVDKRAELIKELTQTKVDKFYEFIKNKLSNRRRRKKKINLGRKNIGNGHHNQKFKNCIIYFFEDNPPPAYSESL